MSNDAPGRWAFVGIDPGVTSGIAWGTFSRFVGTGLAPGNRIWDLHAASCDPEAMLYILRTVLADFSNEDTPVMVFAEKFIESSKRAGKQSDHDTPRQYLAFAQSIAKVVFCVPFTTRAAGVVKPWATDKRLEAVGFPLAPKLKDAKDAGRHLLYGAVLSGRAEDPLA